MNGGIITEDWLETVLDRNPTRNEDGTYTVKGLLYILPSDMSAVQEEEFQITS